MRTFDLNQGALAPVADEVDIIAPHVVGRIPEELHGTFIRNGPNPLSGHFNGNDLLSWWPEAAMVHGISFRDGRALRYRNRWLQTRHWGNHQQDQGERSLIDTNPNVNVVRHAGETLALAEGGTPLAINTDLETLGGSVRHATLAAGMTAHPKIDPVTGELITFRASWSEPWLTYSVADAGGVQRFSWEIEMPGPSMMHDFAITATHSVFMDLSVAYDVSLLSKGYPLPLAWHDDRPSRLGVVPRMGGSIQWFEIEPCFIQHVVNAHNSEDGLIIFDVVRYPWYFCFDQKAQRFRPNPLGVLWRYVIDLKKGTIREHQVDDQAIELPRMNDARTGLKSRYLYAAEQPTDAEIRGLIRYDLDNALVQRHAIANGDQNGEPVFVSNPQGRSEDDGWLLVCVYRQKTDTSDLIILDASDITDRPVATVQLSRRIPAGFHGAWLPGDETRSR